MARIPTASRAGLQASKKPRMRLLAVLEQSLRESDAAGIPVSDAVAAIASATSVVMLDVALIATGNTATARKLLELTHENMLAGLPERAAHLLQEEA